MGGAPIAQALAIAWSIARKHALEFAPVNLAKAPMAAGLIEGKRWVGEGQAQELALRDGGIDKFLPKLIIGKALDAPGHVLVRMGADDVWPAR